MSDNKVNPNNNEVKQEDIVNLWYEATGENFGKVNLATNAEVKDATLAGKKEYVQMVEDKNIPVLYDRPIELGKGQNLHIVFHANTHNFDLSNPQKGIANGTNNLAFKQELADKLPKDKTVVFFSGNLIGTEWKMSNLNNASIDGKQKILFWGLKKRLEELVRDIKFAAKNGANQIILMNGREEHDAKQKLNVDVEREILMTKFNRLLFKYVVEKINSDNSVKHSNVTVAYVPGVKKVFNIVRTDSKVQKSYYTFSVHTNLKTTSDDQKTNLRSAIKQHAGLAPADAIFVQAENFAGTVDDEKNIIFVSGQSTYKHASKGNLPGYSPKGMDSVTLLLGDESHNLQVVSSVEIFNPKSYAVERKLAEEREKEEFLVEYAKKKINEKNARFAQSQSNTDFKKQAKQVEEQGNEM